MQTPETYGGKPAEAGIHWEDQLDLDAWAPPFRRNPSAWSQRIPICVLAGIAAVISTYMAFFQWGLTSSVWDPVFGKGTERVLTSDTAHFMDKMLHVPDAAFGAWGYLSEAILGLAGSTRRWQFRPWMVLIFGIDVIPLGGVSALLILMQGFVVGSWCFLCLITAAISLILIYFAYDEVWASISYLWRVWKNTRDLRLLWRVFWGFPSAKAHSLALVRK